VGIQFLGGGRLELGGWFNWSILIPVDRADVLQGLFSDLFRDGQAPGGKCPIRILTSTWDRNLFQAFCLSDIDIYLWHLLRFVQCIPEVDLIAQNL